MGLTLKRWWYAKLRSRLGQVIQPDQDSIRFYGLCACRQGKVEQVGGEPLRGNAIFWA
ncbi:MAG TPA: CRISPR-associated endonuclease Cas2 [Stenomitos sp.]